MTAVDSIVPRSVHIRIHHLPPHIARVSTNDGHLWVDMTITTPWSDVVAHASKIATRDELVRLRALFESANVRRTYDIQPGTLVISEGDGSTQLE